MGYATTRTLDRVLSACGMLGAARLEFAPADDLANGGVLLALPALLAEGLLRHTREHYSMSPGYYPMETLFMFLALLALARCPSMEQVRYQAPGEWGRLLGLDRLPEVKTLREKVALLCEKPGKAAQWQSQLAKEWMAGSEVDDPALVGLFYADGHVRVYHGGLTQLPRRYVSRQRLCLRGITDYWVNGLGGEPFFVITQVINPGLVKVLRESIIPRLLADAPQPTAEALEADPDALRFTLVVDREGYSPALFAELLESRIGLLTYRKKPGDHWPVERFARHSVRLHTGQFIEMDLAEMGVCLSNGCWVREIRELNLDGSQYAILTTHRKMDLTQVAAAIGARWCQENYLKYMRDHFGLDRLIEHGTTPLPETTIVVNPAHRRLEQEIRRTRAILAGLRAKLGAHVLSQNPSERQVQTFELEGGKQREKIQIQEGLLQESIERRKSIPGKITLGELPEAERFAQLRPESKHFIDTIKMIAYRAESAMAGQLDDHLSRHDDLRALLRRLYATPVNLRPDPEKNTLTVEVHRLGSPLQDAAIQELCTLLTETETVFPTTELRLIYRQVGSA